MLTPDGRAVRFLPLFHFFCGAARFFFLPNFNFYLFSCTCLRQLAQEPHFSVRRQFSQTLHLANISDQSCQLTFEITSKTNTKHFIAMLQGHFSSVLSSEPKKKPTRNKKPTRKDSHNCINTWTTLYLFVSILGLRTKKSTWRLNFMTIIGKVNMQKRQNQRKGKVYAHLSIADCRPRSFFDPKKSSLRCPRTLKKD